MDEMKQEAVPGSPALSAQNVADAFVLQYYNILRASPKDVHRFYKDDSIMARPGSEGMILSATTVQEINDAIMSSSYEGWDPNVEAVHAQESVMRSVIVGVTGSVTDKENFKRKFAQTFFLAPQDTGGFYVRNDFLQFLDVDEPTATLSVPKAVPNSPTALLPNDSENADVPNDEQAIIRVSDPTPKEAFDILKKVGPPASTKNKSELPVTKSIENVQEDSFKKISYASILAKQVSISMPAQVPPPPVAGLIKAGPPTPSKAAPTPLNGTAGVNGGLTAEAPKGIHIKDLPQDMTQEALVEEVKKFGAVRPKSVHIREYPEDGYRYAFVEFESPKSARNAVEAREISIGGRKFEVQYKRSSNQGGNNQGRSMYGRGGYRSDNPWSRDWEGRGGRNDGEFRGSNWTSSTQDQVRGGSSNATKRNGGSTIRV